MYTPSSISSGYAAPLLDLARISTEFSGPITTKFCLTYTLEGVTAPLISSFKML